MSAIDLKSNELPRNAFDAVTCFDVLEHIHDPLPTVRRIHAALTTHGLLFLHAPFGSDPDRPMHVAHQDVVTPRLRSIGFHNRPDHESRFPSDLWAPRVYERLAPRKVDCLGYYLHDVVLPHGAGERLGALYRRLVSPSRNAVPRS